MQIIWFIIYSIEGLKTLSVSKQNLTINFARFSEKLNLHKIAKTGDWEDATMSFHTRMYCLRIAYWWRMAYQRCVTESLGEWFKPAERTTSQVAASNVRRWRSSADDLTARGGKTRLSAITSIDLRYEVC